MVVEQLQACSRVSVASMHLLQLAQHLLQVQVGPLTSWLAKTKTEPALGKN